MTTSYKIHFFYADSCWVWYKLQGSKQCIFQVFCLHVRLSRSNESVSVHTQHNVAVKSDPNTQRGSTRSIQFMQHLFNARKHSTYRLSLSVPFHRQLMINHGSINVIAFDYVKALKVVHLLKKITRTEVKRKYINYLGNCLTYKQKFPLSIACVFSLAVFYFIRICFIP